MTQCSLGSEPKDGLPAFVWLTWDLFLAFIAAKFARLGNALSFVIPDELVDSAVFCATEPVVPEAPDLNTWVKAISRDIVAVAEVSAYLGAAFRAWVWEQSCQCVAPTGGTCYQMDTTNDPPRSNVGPTGDNRMYSRNFNVVSTGVTLYGVRIWNAAGGGTRDLYVWDWSTQPNTPIHHSTFVRTAGLQEITLATPIDLVNGRSYQVSFTVLNELFPSTTTRLQFTSNGHINSGLVYVRNLPQSTVPTEEASVNLALDIVACVGGPPAGDPDVFTAPDPEDPTEIPDPPTVSLCDSFEDVCATINLVLQAVKNQDRKIQWIANRATPFLWEPGTPQTGLTGSGTVAAVGALGALVTVTTLSQSIGWTSETPRRTIPAYGTLQFSIDGVPEDATFLHYETQHVLGAPTATDEIIYNFKPGVVGTIVPLFPVAV